MTRSEEWNPLTRKEIFRSEDWDLVHQTLSANRSGMMSDSCLSHLAPSVTRVAMCVSPVLLDGLQKKERLLVV